MCSLRRRGTGTKRLGIWGTGDEPWHWTSEKNAAGFAVGIVQRDDAAEGGVWRLYSGVDTLKGIAARPSWMVDPTGSENYY